MKNPEFIIYTGPMFGGKTTKMISSLERIKLKNKKIKLFKPKIDDRYDLSKVTTHSGLVWDAINISKGDDILSFLNGYVDVVAVDEAFMIPGISKTLINLFKDGITIYVSSLQLSANNEPFEEIKEMFPYATKIKVCPAICPISGKNAFYTIPKKEGLGKIHVGGSELYEPRSFFHSTMFNQELDI